MDKAHNLQLRGGTYHVRFDVPADVRKAFGGKRILSKSLKTGSLTEAMHRRSPYLTAWWEQVDAARTSVPLPDGWQDEVLGTIGAVDAVFQNQKRGVIGEKVKPLEVNPEMEARILGNPRFMAAFTKMYERHMHNGVEGRLQMLEEIRLGIESMIPTVMSQRQNIPATQMKELSALVANPAAHKPNSPKSLITPKALAAFRAFRIKQNVSLPYVEVQEVRLIRLSAYIVETGKPLDFDCVSHWLDSLNLSGKTQQQHLLAGNAFWKWAMKYDASWREAFKGATSPFERHTIALPKGKAAKEAKRKDFTLPDMERLHTAAQEAGDIPLADLIQLGYFTGARISELCRLRVEHVVIVDGVKMLDIEDSKSAAGIRLVPVHPEIANLVARLVESSTDGFLVVTDFVSKRGDRTGAIGKAFGALKTSLGYDGRHVFHSVRGTTITQLARHDVSYPMICELVGHQTKTVTFDVYSAGFSAQQKFDAICKLPSLKV